MEQFANFVGAVLNGAINSSTTTVVVVDGSMFPTTGNFRIRIDQELMKVTARSSNTLTVVRGDGGSTAVSHSDGVGVDAILTKESLDEFAKDNISSGNYSGVFSATKKGRLYFGEDGAISAFDHGNKLTTFGPLFRFVPPISGNFAWVNQGTATLVTTNGYMRINAPFTASDNMRIQARTIGLSTPYTVTAFLNHRIGPANFACAGLGFRESATSKLIHLQCIHSSSAILEIGKWNNPSSFNAAPAFRPIESIYPIPHWFRVVDNGTVIKFKFSNDRITWYQLFSENRNTFFTTGPNQVYFFTHNVVSSQDSSVSLMSWEEESGDL